MCACNFRKETWELTSMAKLRIKTISAEASLMRKAGPSKTNANKSNELYGVAGSNEYDFQASWISVDLRKTMQVLSLLGEIFSCTERPGTFYTRLFDCPRVSLVKDHCISRRPPDNIFCSFASS